MSRLCLRKSWETCSHAQPTLWWWPTSWPPLTLFSCPWSWGEGSWAPWHHMPGIGLRDSWQPALGGWGSGFLGAVSKDILQQEMTLWNGPETRQETVLPNLRNVQCLRSTALLEMLHQSWPTQACNRKRSKWAVYFASSKLVHKMITSVRSSSNCDSQLFLNRAIVGFFLVMIYFLNSTQLCLPGSPGILGPRGV